MLHGPAESYEELEIRTSGGITLRAICLEPPTAPRASLVLAHAMFARKSSFRRLARTLCDSGFRTVAFDFRSHGASSDSPNWRYDDLVTTDLPAVVECTRARADDHPVLVIGHSLGAHVAIAAQGTRHMAADGIVMLGGNVWLRSLEPSMARWLAKLAIARAMLATVDRVGRFPARRMGMGSDDASAPYMHDLFRGMTTGTWSSAAGIDYMQSASNIASPVAAVLGTRDRIMCHPDSGAAFARHCSGPLAIFEAPAGHMALLKKHAIVAEAVEWALAAKTQARP